MFPPLLVFARKPGQSNGQVFDWLICNVAYSNSIGNLQFIFQVACADL